MSIRGINHVTLAVRDLNRSLRFYVNVLGCRLRARWTRGAYLQAGSLWLCLEVDARAGSPALDDSHVAFSVDAADFDPLTRTLCAVAASLWKENRSEGKSLYVLDPDDHKLEIHVGDLQSRLASCRENPYEGMTFFDDGPNGKADDGGD
jgi:catechol 2,3-dioxygenase-like lactoylglutathione lyase family enzyme